MTILKRATALLQPFMDEARRATWLALAFHGEHRDIHDAIPQSGAPADFTVRCVRLLLDRGCVGSRHALALLLEVVRAEAGDEQQGAFQALIEERDMECRQAFAGDAPPAQPPSREEARNEQQARRRGGDPVVSTDHSGDGDHSLKTTTAPNVASGAPRVFVSYAWEDDEYRVWVERLATRLTQDGIDARLDAWHCRNQTIPEFMNSEARNADKVLIVWCGPQLFDRRFRVDLPRRCSGMMRV